MEKEYYVSTWGYEQTNVTFYEVIKRTAKTITLLEVRSIDIQKGNMTYRSYPSVTPAYNATPRRYKVHEDGEVRIRSFEWARPWRGKAVDGTAYA